MNSEPGLSLVPDVLAAEALLASFRAVRTSGPEAALYRDRFEAADQDTLGALLLFADTAIDVAASCTGESAAALRRRLRAVIADTVGQVQGELN